MAERSGAAFFRVEGTLTARPSVAAAAWLTANAQHVGARVTGLGGVVLAGGMVLSSRLRESHRAHRMAWMGLRDMSLDRLEVLGREYYERYVEPNLLEVGLDLLREARARGQRIVLVSEHLEVVARHLAERLRASDLVSNVMEIDRGRATGRLRPPVLGGNVSGQWARRWAAERAIDLDDSFAYGTSRADGTLLSAIGRPCAVRPDRGLRRMARDLEWPIVEA